MQSLTQILQTVTAQIGFPLTSNDKSIATQAETEPNPTTSTLRYPLPSLTDRSPAWRAAVIGLDESNTVVGRLARTAEGFLRRMIHNDRAKGTWLLIEGNTGTGKSHVAKRLVKQMRTWAVDAYTEGKWKGSRIPQAQYVDWSGITSENIESKLIELGDVDFAALDDIGAEIDDFKNGRPAERLRQVLNMFAHRWLVMTTNLTTERLEAKYDARITSRLAQAGTFNCHGAPDYRREIGKRSVQG